MRILLLWTILAFGYNVASGLDCPAYGAWTALPGPVCVHLSRDVVYPHQRGERCSQLSERADTIDVPHLGSDELREIRPVLDTMPPGVAYKLEDGGCIVLNEDRPRPEPYDPSDRSPPRDPPPPPSSSYGRDEEISHDADGRPRDADEPRDADGPRDTDGPRDADGPRDTDGSRDADGRPRDEYPDALFIRIDCPVRVGYVCVIDYREDFDDDDDEGGDGTDDHDYYDDKDDDYYDEYDGKYEEHDDYDDYDDTDYEYDSDHDTDDDSTEGGRSGDWPYESDEDYEDVHTLVSEGHATGFAVSMVYIAGGVIGTIALIAVIAVALVCVLRKKPHHTPTTYVQTTAAANPMYGAPGNPSVQQYPPPPSWNSPPPSAPLQPPPYVSPEGYAYATPPPYAPSQKHPGSAPSQINPVPTKAGTGVQQPPSSTAVPSSQPRPSAKAVPPSSLPPASPAVPSSQPPLSASAVPSSQVPPSDDGTYLAPENVYEEIIMT